MLPTSITLVAGAVGAADGLVGHTILQYHDAGVTIALDSTMINGPMTLAQYQTSVGFYGITTYGATSSINELAAAATIDTKATKLASVPKLKESFLGAMGLGAIETDSNKVSNGGYLLGQRDNGYYAKAKKFYETVTDTSKNTSFWKRDGESNFGSGGWKSDQPNQRLRAIGYWGYCFGWLEHKIF